MQEARYKELFAELANYENIGIHLKLNNQLASPMQVVSALMLKEETSYMRDYIWDDRGRMKELTFHNINES